MERTQVSGNIWKEPDRFEKDGYMYYIKMNNQSWGLPVKYINPNDLRKLADELEEIRKN